MEKVEIDAKRRKISELMDKKGNKGLRDLIEAKCGAKVADTTLYRMRDGTKTADNTLHFIYYVLTH